VPSTRGAQGSSVLAVPGPLRRLALGGAAYQASSVVAALLALVTLPLYTAALTPADLGVAENVLVFIILASILLRAGLGEALVRLWFAEEDQRSRRRVARAASGTVALVTTVAALAGLLVAGPLAELLSGRADAGIGRLAVLGLWAFTNLEVAYALLRVEERRRAYLVASLANVLLTVALTVALVVGLDAGAEGYLAGNYAASAVVLVALWWVLRDRIGLGGWAPLGPLLRFGAPTVPADAAVFALNVVDRAYLLRAQGAAAAGLFALAVKLATVVIVAVRGFQLAWPPLAYSVADDEQARRLYATVTTWYVVACGLLVAGLTLLGRWVVRLLATPEFFAAHEALPWVALGWALYGLLLVLVSLAGRARVTTRTAPAALAGLVANVVALVILVPALGIAGAGIALAVAHLVSVAVLHARTRALLRVPFEWGRLAKAVAVLAAVALVGELLLPTDGLAGLASRAAALAAAPALLVMGGFLRPAERAALRLRAAPRRARGAASP
jgi:O-antigen/teichoic acid export membrane protein